MANCGQMLRDSAIVTMESLQEITVALCHGNIVVPYNLHFPENGDPVMLPLSNYIGPMTTCMTKIKCTDLKQRYTCAHEQLITEYRKSCET